MKSFVRKIKILKKEGDIKIFILENDKGEDGGFSFREHKKSE